MADINDFTNKNTKFTGTTGQRISTGATGTRVNETGRLRFNSTNNLMEYYNGTEWKIIDAPPAVTSISPSTTESLASGSTTYTITGSGFATGAVVKFVGSDNTVVNGSSVTIVSNTSITCIVPNSSFSAALEPYDIQILNVSGLSGILADGLSIDNRPVFATASGSIGVISDFSRSAYTLSPVTATDPDGDTITYSVTSGSLPTGLSLNSSTGAITGTASSVGSNTTSTFTVSAATASFTSTRSFSITVTAPQSTTFSFTGSDQEFAVPAGVNLVQVEMWGAGGGSGYRQSWGGGGTSGGGGYALANVTVTPSTTYKVVVGQGGNSVAMSSTADVYGGGRGASDGWGIGGGGGLSGFFTGSGQVYSGVSPQGGAHARSLLIAGGGGGGGANRSGGTTRGGAGGGTNGQDGSDNYGNQGAPGTQNAGGGSGNCGGTAGGSELLGGRGNTRSHQPGGGSGYYGGAAGDYIEPVDMGGGGGGSGYAHPNLTSGRTLTTGDRPTPGNSGDGDRGSAGQGRGENDGNGQPGVLIVRY